MNKHGKFFWFKNKFWEFESLNYADPSVFFSFGVRWDFKGDHCGFNIYLEIYRFFIDFKIYDCRHWDYKENRFFEKGKELK